MELAERVRLIKEVGEEILTEEELVELLKKKKSPVAYDGFEPSGTNIHIAQGLLRAININKMIKAGCTFKMFVADWHAWANNKMGGDLEKIQKVGRYYIEVWKACGLDPKKVEFVWASDLLKDQKYWKTVMQIARKSSLKRILRTTQIMGRSESDTLQASQIFYPCMQAADIFHLHVDICQLGLDQRKVSILAREVGPELGYLKPVVVSHHMLMGLQQANYEERLEKGKMSAVHRAIGMKMSKSKPDSAIFMTDAPEEVKRKLRKAWCPEGEIKDNPVLEYLKYIIFESVDSIVVTRLPKFGGDLTLKSYVELEEKFVNKELHPADLKETTATYLNQLLEPIRQKILSSPQVKRMMEEVQSFEVTR